MTSPDIILYVITFLYGIIIGSFLNVCIYRIPKGENIAKVRSHCMECGYQLKWYDLIPVFSYLCLGGKCRKCKTKISIQYPLVELLNGVLYVIVLATTGFTPVGILYCLLASALVVLSVIDFRTFEIPFGINVFIFILGVIQVILDYNNWLNYLIGFFAVSGVMYIVVLITNGFGGGDVKLMAAAGLLLGWKKIVLAFLLGCILGAIIHPIRMWLSKEDHVLAFGPYLAMSIFVIALWGDLLVNWYLSIAFG